MALGVLQSFFTLEDPSFGALSDEVKQRLKTRVCHTTRRMVCGSPTACTFRRLVRESLADGWQLVLGNSFAHRNSSVWQERSRTNQLLRNCLGAARSDLAVLWKTMFLQFML